MRILSGLIFGLLAVAGANHPHLPMPIPVPHLSVGEVADLNEALDEFEQGYETGDRARANHGLNHVIAVGRALEAQGVDLNFDPNQSPAEVAIELRALSRPVWRPASHRIRSFLSACFVVANFACGYDWKNPAESTVTEIDELIRPRAAREWRGYLKPVPN